MGSEPGAARKERLIGGWVALAAGILVVGAMAATPERHHVPAWVGYAAGSTFAWAGAAILAGEFGRTRAIAPWLGFCALLGLVVPALWIAFGPGPRECTATLAFLLATGASEWFCRGAFGLGAGLVVVLIGLSLCRLLQGRGAA